MADNTRQNYTGTSQTAKRTFKWSARFAILTDGLVPRYQHKTFTRKENVKTQNKTTARQDKTHD
jgi:hypothetical protein